MTKRNLIIWVLNIILIFACFITTSYSLDNYTANGCDGGTCVLFYFFHALPLLIVWLINIIAFNLAIKRNWVTFIMLGIGFVINTLLYMEDYGYRHSELYLESEILYAVLIICVLIYIFNPHFGFSPLNEQSDDFPKQKRKLESKLILKSSTLIFLGYDIYCFISILSSFRLNNELISWLIEVITFISISSFCLFFVFKEIKTAFYVLAALLFILLINNLIFSFKEGLLTPMILTFLVNSYMLFALIYEYIMLAKKTNE